MNLDTSRRWSILAAAVVVFFLATTAHVWDGETGLTRLICFGDAFTPRSVPAMSEASPHIHRDSYGYDAQFYAQMAFDPLLLREETAAAMDLAPYRFRRIFMSWVAWLGGAGQPAAILNIFALINVGAWLWMAWLLRHWCRPNTADGFVRWAGCLLSLGAIASWQFALTDLLAMALVLAALRLLERGRSHSAAAALSLAILTKETAVLAGIMGLDGIGGGWKAWRRRCIFGLITVLPMALWTAYLGFRGFHPAAGSSENFALPGFGLWEQLREAFRFLTEGRKGDLVVVLSLIVQAVGLLWFRRPRSPVWRVGAVHVVLGLVLGRAVWEGYPGAACRVLLPLTVAFNLTIPRDTRWKWAWLVGGNLSAVLGINALYWWW
jgi:hypothetical protein